MLRWLLTLSILAAPLPASAEPPAAPPGEPVPARSAARAAAPGHTWLGLFAEGGRFGVRRLGAGYDLQGGAYLQLLGSLALRGGYRIFDYDASEGDSSWETDHHGLAIGFSLRF